MLNPYEARSTTFRFSITISQALIMMCNTNIQRLL